MSRQMFEGVQKAYEIVKKTVAEKWEAFKNKFEGTKSEMANEVMKAESPEDLIATGKKLQEQGEALKLEQESVKQEEAGEDQKHEAAETEMKNELHGEANEMNKEFDANKAAEEAALEKARIAEEDRLQAVAEAEQLAAVRAKLNGESVEAPVAQESAEPVVVENGAVENTESAAEANEKGRHNWESDPEFEALKKSVAEVHGQSRYNEEADKRAKDLSKELFSRLKTSEDFKEVASFLSGETRSAAYKKWEELSEKEIEEASSEEEMKMALKNINPIRDSKYGKLMEVG